MPVPARLRYSLVVPTVAEQLRHAREAMNLDVREVAETTKLKADHIRALEQGEYGSFTAPVYLRGSLRTYANLLKLDAAALIAQLETELSSSTEGTMDGQAPQRRKSGVDSLMLLLSRLNWGVAGAVAALALLVLGANVSYRAWKHRKQSDPLQNIGAGMYQPAEPAGELLPLPTNNPRRAP